MAVPSLHEVQRLFWESVAAQPGRDSIAPTFVTLVRGRNDRERTTRIQAYSDAYYLRLRDVLNEDFPRVSALLGPIRFDALILDYLTAFPSKHPSVRHLGRALPEFFRSQTDAPGCLADLAELEWARVEVFDAPDAECAAMGDLVSVPPDAWPTLRFLPIPALQTLHIQHPVHQVWSGGQSLDVPAADTSLRVWRTSDYQVFHAPMDHRETVALRKMIEGEPFAAICEAFADLPNTEAAQEATALLARWIEDGIICYCRRRSGYARLRGLGAAFKIQRTRGCGSFVRFSSPKSLLRRAAFTVSS